MIIKSEKYIRNFMRRMTLLLETNVWCHYKVDPTWTNRTTIKLLKSRGITATIEKEPHSITDCPVGPDIEWTEDIVVFQWHNWKVFITEEVHAINTKGIKAYSPGF